MKNKHFQKSLELNKNIYNLGDNELLSNHEYQLQNNTEYLNYNSYILTHNKTLTTEDNEEYYD
jgi:hypothetical protein